MHYIQLSKARKQLNFILWMKHSIRPVQYKVQTLNSEGRKQKVATIPVDHIRGESVSGSRISDWHGRTGDTRNGVVRQRNIAKPSFENRYSMLYVGLSGLQGLDLPENSRSVFSIWLHLVFSLKRVSRKP